MSQGEGADSAVDELIRYFASEFTQVAMKSGDERRHHLRFRFETRPGDTALWRGVGLATAGADRLFTCR